MTSTRTTLTVKSLGHRGDGIADGTDGPIFIPGALPGETVLATLEGNRAVDVEIETPSPDRRAPVCRHYDDCGGCTVQHLEPSAYLEWKRDLVGAAFSARGLAPEIAPCVPATDGGRRRAVLTATRAAGKILLGYHAKASHRLVDIRECPVLVPEIVQVLPGLRALAKEVMPKKGDVRFTVTATTSGLDVAVENAVPSFDRRLPALTALAMKLNLARLTVNGEIVLEVRPPVLDMADVQVVPSPGAFTQATRDAEEKLSELVLAALPKCKTVADLFCGVGTFALRLARKANVHAVEGDAGALTSLENALRKAKGLKKVTRERRDLMRRPLVRQELEAYDVVVFDPPRAGAQAQAEQLAVSKVKTIIAVSCNPATLARDVKILEDGGYELRSVTPVDQFLYSTHVECVAVLQRP